MNSFLYKESTTFFWLNQNFCENSKNKINEKTLMQDANVTI